MSDVVYDARLRKILIHSHDGVTPAPPVGACSNIQFLRLGTTMRVRWTDPDDLEVEGVTVAKWARTVLVRKTGGYPVDANDGTVVVSSTVRNAYSSTLFEDTLPDADTTYYYRLCPVTDWGAVNLEDDNRFMAEALTWSKIAEVVRGGLAADLFSVGDTLTVPHSTYGDIVFEVAGFDVNTPTDTTKTHSMTLLSESVLALAQFDAAEKAYALTDDTVFHPEYQLAINIKGAATATIFAIEDKTATGNARVWYSLNGAYKLMWSTTDERWEVYSATSGTHALGSRQDYQSTASAEPTGGVWNSGTVVAADKVYYTFDGTDYTAATVQAGDAVTANTYYEKNPHDNRVSYGYNNWQQSAIRQWLNSDAAAGGWWQPQNIWDNAPSNASTSAGFLAGITDAEFLAAIGAVDITTTRNTITDCGGNYVTSDKVFLASRKEIFGTANNGVDEGVAWPLFEDAEDADRIKYQGTTARSWWLRSPTVGYAHSEYNVYTSGVLNNHYAYNTYGAVPACVIC